MIAKRSMPSPRRLLALEYTNHGTCTALSVDHQNRRCDEQSRQRASESFRVWFAGVSGDRRLCGHVGKLRAPNVAIPQRGSLGTLGSWPSVISSRAGVVTRTLARIQLSGKMGHDDLVCRHQFPPAIIRRAVWLYLRFTLSYRDVEDLRAERGLDVSYETVRRWVLKLGPLFARELRRRRPRPTSQWHLDEIAG
jgi:hypothetical protein